MPSVLDFGDHAGDLAGALFGGRPAILEQRREAVIALVERVRLGADQLGDDGVERAMPFGQRRFRCGDGSRSSVLAAPDSTWPCCSKRLAIVAMSSSTLLVTAWNDLICFSTSLLALPLRSPTSFSAMTKSFTRVDSVPSMAPRLSVAPAALPAAARWLRAGARTAQWCRCAACCGFPASRRPRRSRSAATSRSQLATCLRVRPARGRPQPVALAAACVIRRTISSLLATIARASAGPWRRVVDRLVGDARDFVRDARSARLERLDAWSVMRATSPVKLAPLPSTALIGRSVSA